MDERPGRAGDKVEKEAATDVVLGDLATVSDAVARIERV